MSEVFAEFNRNEDKFYKRMWRDDVYGFEDGTTERYNIKCCVPDFAEVLFRECFPQQLVEKAFALLTPIQQSRVKQLIFGKKSFAKIAAITSVIKKQFLPMHIIVGNRFGLKSPSMVMLEQLKTVNQSDLIEYIGKIDDEHCMKKLNIGIKKALGLWVDKPLRKPSDIRCLCVKCLEDYKSSPNYIVKRLDPFARVK